MLKCKKCGSKDFWVNEGYCWKAFVDDEGVLQCTNPTAEIEAIICKKCNAEYSERDFDFKEINFN